VGFAEPETLQRYFEEGGESETIDEITFEEVEALRRSDDAAVLDVRYRSEYDEGHVEGALNASYTRMPEYETDLPPEKTLLVHCRTGARAAAASAYLRRAGREVKYVNDKVEDYLEDQEPAVAA
jgi:hydroxyacylglutathione hydrolase